MGKVKRLSDRTINQIAAGEVVEGPTSVVKELMENAIDSGATAIKVEIEAGGKARIRVYDNGCGMGAEDLEVSIERHATSKLDENNLNYINSLGFRGEALPSIGAIANLIITTRASDAQHAICISVRGGERGSVEPSAGTFGTVVEVQDLFAYTPVRMKFLRTDAAERASVMSIMEQFALCYKDIHFTLISEGKIVADFAPARDLAERVNMVLGPTVYSNLLPVEKDSGNMSLIGFIGLPTFSQRTTAAQYVFINGRAVKDKLVQASLKAAYANIMESKGYPAAVLYLTLDPYEVDVNVHPAKTEVRFRDKERAKSFLISAIRATLRDAAAQTSSGVQQTAVNVAKQAVQSVPQSTMNFAYERPGPAYQPPTLSQSIATLRAQVPKAQDTQPAEGHTYMLGTAICQLDSTYIVAKSEAGLVIVDQHAAHERLVLEALKQQEVGIKTQHLLIPEIVQLNEATVERLCGYKDKLKAMGIHMEKHGISEVLVRQIPTFLAASEVAKMLMELGELLAVDDDGEIFEHKREEILGTLACHSSIRAGRSLSVPEMNALLRQIESTPLASQCNHGRPTFVILKESHLAKIFERS